MNILRSFKEESAESSIFNEHKMKRRNIDHSEMGEVNSISDFQFITSRELSDEHNISEKKTKLFIRGGWLGEIGNEHQMTFFDILPISTFMHQSIVVQ